MKKTFLFLAMVSLLLFSCANQTHKKTAEENPFLSEFNTPFNVPPFNKIKEVHYLPAFKEGIKQQQKEIEAIVSSTELPTFEDTIESVERSGSLLTKVGNVFDILNGANTNAEMQKIAKDAAPLLSKHEDDIKLNAILFERV